MCDYCAELQKAKSKAQRNNNLKEEANICNQLGELLSRNGKFIWRLLGLKVLVQLHYILCIYTIECVVKGICAEGGRSFQTEYIVVITQIVQLTL